MRAATKYRRFFCDNALMWLRDYHVDGLRLDAVHALVDTSATHLLEQLAAEVDDLEATIGRHLVLIAESDLDATRAWSVQGKTAGTASMRSGAMIFTMRCTLC